MAEHQKVIDLLYGTLGAIPHADYGHINLMPFAHDSDQINMLKRQVAEGIASVLSDAGLLRDPAAPEEQAPREQVLVQCRMCSAELVTLQVDGAFANVPAATLIASFAKLSPECPHKVITPDDQRRAIQEAVLAADSGD